MNHSTIPFLLRSRSNARNNSTRESESSSWKILIVDDEVEVHNVTQLVLSDVNFEGRPLEFLHAYSSHQAIAKLLDHPDTALALIDVVMDGDDAGLRLIEYIRNTLKNKLIRIVLRTGQPGTAPEREVLLKYEINDYKTKADLSSARLYSTIITGLRSYKDLHNLEISYRAVDRHSELALALLKTRSIEKFASVAIAKIAVLLEMNPTPDYFALFMRKTTLGWEELACAGTPNARDEHIQILPTDDEYTQDKPESHQYRVSMQTEEGDNYQILINTTRKLSKEEKKLLDIFETNAQLALSRIHSEQRARMAYQTTLKTIVHKRSPASSSEIEAAKAEHLSIHAPWCAGTHDCGADFLFQLAIESAKHQGRNQHKAIKRLAHISKTAYELSRLIRLDETHASMIAFAGIVHDVGIILCDNQFSFKWYLSEQAAKDSAAKHTEAGSRFLMQFSSPSNLMETAATVAASHHEAWNGTGFPRKLRQQKIPIEARIVAISIFLEDLIEDIDQDADQNIEISNCLTLIKQASGYYFDPQLIKPLREVACSRHSQKDNRNV